MNTPTSKTISLHEKLSSSEAFLFLIGIVLYTEAFLSFHFNMTISVISSDWYKEDVSIVDIVLYFLCFSLFYGVVIPFLLFTLNIFLDLKFPNKQNNFEGYIKLSKIKSDAIVDSNSALYKHYENIILKLTEAEKIRKLGLAIILLIITVLVSYFQFGAEGKVLSGFWEVISRDGYTGGVIRIIFAFIFFWLLAIVLNYEAEHNYAEKINNYEQRLENKWLSELSSGLLNKDDVLQCLQEIKSSYSYPSLRVTYNSNNLVHIYCETHGLISTKDQEIQFTAKGNFYKKYLTNPSEG